MSHTWVTRQMLGIIHGARGVRKRGWLPLSMGCQGEPGQMDAVQHHCPSSCALSTWALPEFPFFVLWHHLLQIPAALS